MPAKKARAMKPQRTDRLTSTMVIPALMIGTGEAGLTVKVVRWDEVLVPSANVAAAVIILEAEVEVEITSV
jgi:hypothetical protein